MKTIQLLLLAISLIFPAFALADQHTEHKHETAVHAQLQLNDGKKWNTDVALRHAMGNIHASVTRALLAIHAGKLGAKQYDTLGKDITAQLAFIVQNCKLDPHADEQLHLIIAGIASGIDMATAKQSTHKRAQAIHKIAESLNTYGKYFDHPDWQILELSQH